MFLKLFWDNSGFNPRYNDHSNRVPSHFVDEEMELKSFAQSYMANKCRSGIQSQTIVVCLAIVWASDEV